MHRLAACLTLATFSLLTSPVAAQQTPWSWFAFGEDTSDGGDLTGRSVAILPDIDGDGADDVLIGAPGDEDGGSTAGTAYVVSGASPFSIPFEIHGTEGDQ